MRFLVGQVSFTSPISIHQHKILKLVQSKKLFDVNFLNAFWKQCEEFLGLIHFLSKVQVPQIKASNQALVLLLKVSTILEYLLILKVLLEGDTFKKRKESKRKFYYRRKSSPIEKLLFVLVIDQEALLLQNCWMAGSNTQDFFRDKLDS